jgi:hypothetical protein
MDLYPPLRIKGKSLGRSEVMELETKMAAVLKKLVSLAETVFQVRPPFFHSQVYEPWNVPFAARYDKRTLGS